MKYESIINQLLNEFPSLQEEYEELDYLWGLPHGIFETLLVPYICNLCKDKNEIELRKVGLFLEKLISSDEVKIQEVINVSVLEPIVLSEKDVIPVLKNFLKEKTLKELDYWQQRYSK